MLIENNYPYPDKNIYFLFGGVNEAYIEAYDFKYPSNINLLLSKSTVDILNKLQSMFIVAKNKTEVNEYIKAIQPNYWKAYTLLSLYELKKLIFSKKNKSIKLSKDDKEYKIEYMIRYFDSNEIDFFIAGKDINLIKEWISINKNKKVSYIMPVLALTEVIEELTELKYGRNKEKEIFISNWEDFNKKILEEYSQMSDEDKREIINLYSVKKE